MRRAPACNLDGTEDRFSPNRKSLGTISRPPAKGVPLPCKPDSVPLLRGWTAISLTPPRRSALLAQGATNTRE